MSEKKEFRAVGPCSVRGETVYQVERDYNPVLNFGRKIEAEKIANYLNSLMEMQYYYQRQANKRASEAHKRIAELEARLHEEILDNTHLARQYHEALAEAGKWRLAVMDVTTEGLRLAHENEQLRQQLTKAKIQAGICPDCGSTHCMADGVTGLWCAECDASWLLEEEE